MQHLVRLYIIVPCNGTTLVAEQCQNPEMETPMLLLPGETQTGLMDDRAAMQKEAPMSNETTATKAWTQDWRKVLRRRRA